MRGGGPTGALSARNRGKETQAQAQALPGPIDSRLTALAGVALAADDLLDGEAVDGVVLRLVEARHADGHAGGAGVPPARTARVGAAVAGGGSGRSRRVLEEGGKHGAVVVADAAAERRAAARGDDGAVAVADGWIRQPRPLKVVDAAQGQALGLIKRRYRKCSRRNGSPVFY